jgi:hypothetical protein
MKTLCCFVDMVHLEVTSVGIWLVTVSGIASSENLQNQHQKPAMGSHDELDFFAITSKQ